jgi:hypothetical protein
MIIAWIFKPDETDHVTRQTWERPPGLEEVQELAIKFTTDSENMADITMYAPGWKRAVWLDQPAE